MKTAFPPDSLAAYAEAARELALANPAAALAVLVLATAAFATWVARF